MALSKIIGPGSLTVKQSNTFFTISKAAYTAMKCPDMIDVLLDPNDPDILFIREGSSFTIIQPNGSGSTSRFASVHLAKHIKHKTWIGENTEEGIVFTPYAF